MWVRITYILLGWFSLQKVSADSISVPTSYPSANPSYGKTRLPSSTPSKAPTVLASSLLPTPGKAISENLDQPTSTPTKDLLDSNPTISPSIILPTSMPTSLTTNNPVSLPTSIPTANFFPNPTSQPSSILPNIPTRIPSLDPNVLPTFSPTETAAVQSTVGKQPNGLSGSQIAGILAVVIFAAVLAVCVCFKHRREERYEDPEDSDQQPLSLSMREFNGRSRYRDHHQ